MKYFRIKIKYFIILFFLIMVITPVSVFAMTIIIGIPESYTEINAGEKVYFETEVKWPENVGRKDLRIEYSIKDSNNKEISYLKVLKAIETQASFMDSIPIPESTKPGIYKIDVNIHDYEDLSHEVTASFHVKRSADSLFIFLYVIIGILGVLLILTLSEVLYLLRRKIYPVK